MAPPAALRYSDVSDKTDFHIALFSKQALFQWYFRAQNSATFFFLWTNLAAEVENSENFNATMQTLACYKNRTIWDILK